MSTNLIVDLILFWSICLWVGLGIFTKLSIGERITTCGLILAVIIAPLTLGFSLFGMVIEFIENNSHRACFTIWRKK